MLRIGICDDVSVYGEKLAAMVKGWCASRQVNARVQQFFSGEELLLEAEAHGFFDIVFMDIELGRGINGVETAARLKEFYKYTCLIFISQYDYYREAYRVHPFHFLEKTAAEKKIWACLDQAVKNYHYLYDIYNFRFKGVSYSILLRDVLYFVSDRRIVRIYMENGDQFTFYEKLDDLEEKLNQYSVCFLRIHKSYLVNVRQVEQYHPKYMMMRNRERLPVSLDKRDRVMQFQIKYLASAD